MKVTFENKKLIITNCFFDAVEVMKDGVTVADIPLVNGEGFITNTNDVSLSDGLTLYPYNIIEIESLEAEQELK